MKQKEFNLKAFMQSEERSELLDQINKELNHNTIMFNTKGKTHSNLLIFDKKYKRSKQEILDLKKVKSNYKKLIIN